jgi:hypothetical protein
MDESAVTADIAYNGAERPLYWSNSKVTAAINSYLAHRVEHQHRITTRQATYRRLDPAAPIFLTDEGEPYRLTERRTLTCTISYSCDSLSQLFRKLHLQAGIEGASAMSAHVCGALGPQSNRPEAHQSSVGNEDAARHQGAD